MRPNESGTTRVSMSRTIASLNDLRIFVTRSSADSITFDTIRKRSKPCFIPFFKMDVELFMRTYIGLAAVLISQQKTQDALPHLKKAIALNVDNEVSWYRLSQVQMALGNTAEQQKAFAEFQRLRTQKSSQQEAARELFSRWRSPSRSWTPRCRSEKSESGCVKGVETHFGERDQ